MTDFKPPALPLWATHISGRSPEFKMHKTRGHAVAALGSNPWRSGRYTRAGTLFEFVDGEWVEVHKTTGGLRIDDALFGPVDRKRCEDYNRQLVKHLAKRPSEYSIRSTCPFCNKQAWELAGYKERPTLAIHIEEAS